MADRDGIDSQHATVRAGQRGEKRSETPTAVIGIN